MKRERDRLREIHCTTHLKIYLCPCKSIHATKYILMLLQKSTGFSCTGLLKSKAYVVFILVFLKHSNLVSFFLLFLKIQRLPPRCGGQRLCQTCNERLMHQTEMSNNGLTLFQRWERTKIPGSLMVLLGGIILLSDIDLAQIPPQWPLIIRMTLELN